jgi:hypothetical protein
MSPAAGHVLTVTPISRFLLSTLIFGGAITVDIVASILVIAIGLVLTLRPRALGAPSWPVGAPRDKV